MQKIVAGYDGTEQARSALKRAAFLGHQGAEITVVCAVGKHANAAEIVEQKRRLDEAAALLKMENAGATFVDKVDDPAKALISIADELGADLIIVGSRGRTGAKAALLGSVSTEVVQKAHCDVLVVR